MHLLLTPLKHMYTMKHIIKRTVCMATVSVISPWATTSINSKQNLNFWWPTILTQNIFPWWGQPNIELLLWNDWQFIWDSKGLWICNCNHVAMRHIIVCTQETATVGKPIVFSYHLNTEKAGPWDHHAVCVSVCVCAHAPTHLWQLTLRFWSSVR